MSFNFELILFYAALITGLIYLFDVLLLARKRVAAHTAMPWYIDYSRSFFPILLIVFLFRSFLFEPFRIPSGSLEPTLLTGDFILVNKFNYGLRLPVLHTQLTKGHEPQRGDIMVFRFPPDPSLDFIKRVIGLPGDRISYVNKELLINGQKIPQTYLKQTLAYNENDQTWQALEKTENLLGLEHRIFIDPQKSSQDYHDIVVPAGMYFVMGDNRDDSADSRYWGFVPANNIVGKAMFVWLSWDKNNFKPRWERMGHAVH